MSPKSEINSTYCIGLSPLLDMCASNILSTKEINYVIYQNTYDPSRFNTDVNNEIKFAHEIAGFFGHTVNILGPYNWKIENLTEKTNRKYTFDEPEIDLCDGDLVSGNLMLFLGNKFKGQFIEIFPEGSSCLNLLANKLIPKDIRIFPLIWNYKIKPVIRKIRDYFKKNKIYIKTNYIISDQNGIIEKLINGDERFKLLNCLVIINNYRRISQYFAKKYPVIDYRNVLNMHFHPVMTEIGMHQYQEWMIEINKRIRDEPLLIKKHPRDNRDTSKFFTSPNAIVVPDEFRSLPAQILIHQTNSSYIGFLSTTILSLPLERVILMEPYDKFLVKTHKKEAIGLVSILNRGSLKLPI